MKKIALYLVLILAISACVHSTIVPFQPSTNKTAPAGKYPPTTPEDIGIYRSMKPFVPFTELGLITLHLGALDLPAAYNQIRKDAAAYGAEAVVDLKIHGETHIEYRMETDCIPRTVCTGENICTTQTDCTPRTIPESVSNYTFEGSMIRRAQ